MSHAWVIALAVGNVSTLSSHKITLLDGVWEARFSDEGGASDRGEWRPIRVPGNFSFQGINHDGIVWVRTQFTVEAPSTDFAVRVPMAANAHQVFVNGTLLGGRGIIGLREELVEKDLRGRVYRLPKDLLRTAEPNSLSLRIRTFYGNGGVIAPGVWIGSEELVHEQSNRELVLVSMLVSLFFFAAFFYFILHFAHRDERQYLSFAFLAACLGTITAGMNTLGYLVTLNADFNAYLVFVPLLVLPMGLVRFFGDFLGDRPKRIQQSTSFFAIVSTAILVASTFHHPIYPLFERVVLPASILVLGGTTSFAIGWTVRAFLRRHQGARVIVVGLAVYALTAFAELAWSFALLPFRVDSQIGFAFLVAAMVVAVSGRYSRLNQEVRLWQLSFSRGEARHSIDLLAAEVGHELAFPLNSFRHFLGRLSTGKGVSAEDIAIGQEEVARLERMLASARRLQLPLPNLQATELNPIVERAVSLLRDEFDEGDQQVELDLAPRAVVRADKDHVLQIVTNLLRNGSQAAGDRGRLGAVTRKHSSHVELIVWDEGPGIPAETMSRIFSPWFTTRQQSSGLGLAVTLRIVRSLGWSIDVERKDHRTCFVVRAHSDEQPR
jgi:signal transduction histidine kinase